MTKGLQFEPITLMRRRIEKAYEDSDASAFEAVMVANEMYLKLTVCGLVAAIQEDSQKNKYRLIHNLVRADGLGEWTSALDEILTGPPSQYLLKETQVEVQQLTQKVKESAWQHEVAMRINRCLRLVKPDTDPLPLKVSCRYALNEFVTFRNKTRGHGAITSSQKAECVKDLEDAFRIFVFNLQLFRRPWAFLYRNLSGKYRVTSLTPLEADNPFSELKTNTHFSYSNGVYVAFDKLAEVELVYSDAETSDFFIVNGNFTNQKFEMLSYISGSVHFSNPGPYLEPATPLPQSHTSGGSILDLQERDKAFSNLPLLTKGYISRKELQEEVESVLSNSFPIVTLVGKGGIGKTSLALAVLHQLKKQENFEAILWFSARDIDLLPEGPKNVSPDVLDEKDIAHEFVGLIDPARLNEKGFDELGYFRTALQESPTKAPYLYVFDNFETVRNPVELFKWLATYVRSPNKILITTRFRDFNGDWKITVSGMNEDESNSLVMQTAYELGIADKLTPAYIKDLIKESDGHPYVIKMLLGEATRTNNFNKIERILASSDEILTALFERTYNNLTPLAKRVFLTLCHWRSSIPEIALEAVLMRSSEERVNANAAIAELEQSSLIEIVRSSQDESKYVSVPLVAHVFGQKKIAVSPFKTKIEIDKDLLMFFGAIQDTDVKHGFQPRVERFLQNIAKRLDAGQKLEDYLDLLEFIGRHYSPAWLQIASLYEEYHELDKAKSALQSYLESSHSNDDRRKAWEKLAAIYRRDREFESELHALVEVAETPGTWIEKTSEMANRANGIFSEGNYVMDKEEKEQLISRLIKAMEDSIDKVNATDLSRIAWLMLNINDSDGAKRMVKLGLAKDPNNNYCNRLASKLNLRTNW